MVLTLARPLVSALLSPAMVQPVTAQGVEAEGARGGQGLAMGLMVLAAVDLLLHERREDREEERNEREKAARRLPRSRLDTSLGQDDGVRLHEPGCLDASFKAAPRLPLDHAVTLCSEGRFVSGVSPSCLREGGWLTQE